MTAKEIQKRNSKAESLRVLQSEDGQFFVESEKGKILYSVTINDEEVNVDADGHFRKAVEVPHDGWNDLVIAAVDPAGNRTERRQRVYVEVY